MESQSGYAAATGHTSGKESTGRRDYRLFPGERRSNAGDPGNTRWQWKLVRKYSSTDKVEAIEEIAPKHPIPMYWVRAEQALSNRAGMHRFDWDARYAAPPSLGHGFPIAAILHDTPLEPRGALALPGKYTVRLSANGKSYSQALILKMDPRVKGSATEILKQWELQQLAAHGNERQFCAIV